MTHGPYRQYAIRQKQCGFLGVLLWLGILLQPFSAWAAESHAPLYELKLWQFIPGQLVSPDEKDIWLNAAERRIPGGWEDLAPGENIASLRTVFIPPTREEYGLVVGEISSAATVYVNGKKLGSIGYPSLDKATTQPGRGKLVLRLDGADRYEILIHISVFYNSQGGMWAIPKIAPYKQLTQKLSQDEVLEGCFFGGILAIGIYHLFLFFIRREPISGTFGLCCLAVALRMGFSNTRIVGNWVNVSWHISFFLEYFGLYAIAPTIELFFATIFPKDYPRKLWPLRVLPYALTFLTLCFDVITMNRYLMVVHLHHVIVMGIVSYTLFRAIKKQRLGSAWIVFGSVFMILFSLIDIGKTYLGLAGTFVIQFGFSIFILSQAAAIAQVYSEIYRRLLVEEEKQVKINEELQRLDRLKDDFLANTSHELRTPLHAMIGLGEAILHQSQVDSKTQERMEMILGSAKRLALLVNDILDFSKLRHQEILLQRSPVDLQALAHMACELIKPMIGQKPIQLSWHVEGQLARISADANRLQQILLNLLGNAIKFTHEGKVQLVLRRQGAWIEILISDTGIGIPANKLASIFDSFTQANSSTAREFGGTGLGLAVTKKLVELHSGDVQVQSEEGKGTTFTVRLPFEEAAGVEIPMLHQTERVERDRVLPLAERTEFVEAARARILVADDDPINLEVLKAQLQPIGYQLTCVTDAFAALKALEQSGPYDLALFDVMMPRMSGYELTRRIRDRINHYELPIVLLTAKSQPEDIAHGFEAGANDYLLKPFARVELLARIQTLETLTQQSKALGFALRDLKEEAQAKVLMVKDLAHRSNNPLYATQLCLVSHQDLLSTLERFIVNLFGAFDSLDQEHRAVVEAITRDFGLLKKDVSLMNPLLEKVAQAIVEIRVLSGVDGRSTCEFEVASILPEIEVRLQESLGELGAKKVALRLTAAGPFITEGHPLVFVLSLERLIRQMVIDSQEPIDCFIDLARSSVPHVILEFRSAITGDCLELSAESLELLWHLQYMLKPYGMSFEVRASSRRVVA